MAENIKSTLAEIQTLLDTFDDDKEVQLAKKYLIHAQKTYGYLYTSEFGRIRASEKNKKAITSVAIHGDNIGFISKLQDEAKSNCFFLSKENIINMALFFLKKEYSQYGDVVELIDVFFKEQE